MFDRIRSMKAGDAVGLMIVGAVVTLMLSGTAMAITDTDFTYSTPKTGRLAIHPLHMDPMIDGIDYSITEDNVDVVSGVGGCFHTGVDLPNGARIQNLQMFMVPDSAAAFDVIFLRHELATNAKTYLLNTTTGGPPGERVSTTHPVTDGQVVNSNKYAYGFYFCMGVDDKFEGARIIYTYTSAGD